MNVPKTILLVSNIFWTISTFRKYLIQELIAHDYQVICIGDIDNFSNDSVHILEALGAKCIQIKINRKGLNPFEDILYIWRLYSTLKKIKPNLIINYTIKPVIYGSIVSWLLKIPSLAVLTGLGSSFLKQNFLTKFIHLLYKFALSKADKVFFLNQNDKKIFTDHQLCDVSKLIVVPGEGIDTDEFVPIKSEATAKLRFILIARLLKDKGIYDYIAAIQQIYKEKKLNNLEFLLAGPFDEGNPSAITPKQINEWENAGIIRYLGKTDHIQEFFALADVVILPSYREGLSRLLLEAAACEKPLIASKVPGCKELIHEGKNGFLCKPKDSSSLTNAIKKMCNLSYSERIQFGVESRRIVVREFGKDKVNAIYLQAIEEIL